MNSACMHLRRLLNPDSAGGTGPGKPFSLKSSVSEYRSIEMQTRMQVAMGYQYVPRIGELNSVGRLSSVSKFLAILSVSGIVSI